MRPAVPLFIVVLPFHVRRERKRVRARNRCETTRRQVSQQRSVVNQFLVVEFRRADVVRVRIGRDDFTGDKTVFAEATNGLVMFALEKQVRVLDEFSVDLLRRKRREAL